MPSNFDFIRAQWPELFDECARAEHYVRRDPRVSAIYARRALEQVVTFVYDVARLPAPYRNDLNAKINAAEFRTLAGQTVAAKCNVVRKVGNNGAHDVGKIDPRTAMQVLAELHHVVYWTAFRYSTAPDQLRSGLRFDPALVAPPAGGPKPLSRAELDELLGRLRTQDEQIARTKAANDNLQAELDRLRAQIAAAQAAKAPAADTHDYDEAQTRDLFIDVLLQEAGWTLDQERDREFEVAGMPSTTGTGYVDYVLWGEDGLPLAVVEAKRTRRDAAVGQQQAKLYADCLENTYGQRPVIYFTNGYEHRIWDDAAGYPPRDVQGFHTRAELTLMVQRRTTRLRLADTLINRDIVERHYQQRAIRAIGEAFERRQREALVVMATGAGKTRTVIALVDQLMRAGWVKRVLFLADRVELVKQAANAFTTHLPSVTTVNLVTDKITDGRVFVSTYPTVINLINEIDGTTRPFGPGHFDLVIIDEAHRSVYQKYRSIFDWFDGLLVGLTATPKDEVDRNTYALFHLEDGVPTDVYTLDEAVDEGYLVPPAAVSVPLKFLRQGIRYADLSDAERDEWDSLEWSDDGDVPDAVGADELNRWLFNADTVDKVLATLMTNGHRVAGGDRIGKTIIFAKNNDHAEFIGRRFDLAYPEYGGQHARVITYRTEYAGSLVDSFKIAENAPHIAISVDMLDTGIDVPEVVNLVFFKIVRSKSKFWQMIGRGTRLCPDLYGPGADKKDFYVFDFCQNLEFFSQDPQTSDGSLQQSLAERLFRARLGLVATLDANVEPADLETTADEAADGTETDRGLRTDTARHLHRIVEAMNLDNFVVRPQRRWVQTWSDWTRWQRLTADTAAEIADRLAGLPSALRDDDEQAKRFDLLVLRIQLGTLDGDHLVVERLRTQVQEIAAALLGQTTIPAVAAQQELLDELAGDGWWVDVTLPMLELARRRVRGLVRFVEKAKRAVVYTDFADELGVPSTVVLPRTSVGTNFERFRAKARAYLREHEDHVALQRLRRNLPLTPDDLVALEQMLRESGAGDEADIARAREESRGLGLFVRSLVGLDREAATEAFSAYLVDTGYSSAQIDFVGLIVAHLTENGVLDAARLYEPPFTDRAPHGPEGCFTDEQVDGLILVLDNVRAHAVPDATVA